MANVNMTVEEASGILDAVDRGEIEVGSALMRHLNLIVAPRKFQYLVQLSLTLDEMDTLDRSMKRMPAECFGLAELKRIINNHAHARGELEAGL